MEFYFPSSFYELYKQYSSSSISIATHTHALALFVLYLFVRFYRSKRSVAAASAGAVCTVKNNNINNSTDESKSSTSRSSHSSSSRRKSQSQETAYLYGKSSDDNDDDDDTLLLLSQIEKDESLQQQSGSSTSTSRTKSTLAERRRFLIANKNNLNGTIQQLRSYIEWKNNHIDKKIQIKSTGDKDYDIWVESSLTAMKICDGEVENIVLPRIIRTHSSSNSNNEQHYIDRDGYRTFCVTPALMDNNLAKGSRYTQAVAIYLDRCLDPSENEMITILFDCRAGTGWSNNHVLPPLVPERLQKAIVYPVPYTFMYIWSMLSKGLDPTTKQMKLHLYEDHMEELESSRIAGFKI
ncbi:hypothetical protein FRACYDRAFT_236777 [Fragilariopsis cylindrus CCMP1102]|uniref:CRAL-TRIO domain-containing protein n=1 Tax=Fragilariopsis cylindrus CCMP1102 TaxID=635003 RepID=A0A1E7FJY2_9STRA|nr:hypothetical protein FRACYDRAFT_236777 [Fragilariopsis cylindrus CCMP1102]|eukprot:OEU18499.1 hypothetical protein FRACYDRAFT_236777 [Fragilariopsis cylindrus CCMP1102]